MLTLYQVEWCPYCHRVREVLTELELPYKAVNVPRRPKDRKVVRKVSGQELVPVLVDGGAVAVGSGEAVRHLRETYPQPADFDEHVDAGAWRDVLRIDAPPDRVLARLRVVLKSEALEIVAEIAGDQLAPGRMPPDYTLVLVASPVAAAHVAQIDPTVATAVTVPIAVYAADGGTELAMIRPGATVWLYREPELLRTASAVAQRLVAALSAL